MDKRAFTLIEIIIATIIVALLAAGMLGSFVGAEYFFNRARHRLQAVNFAREALDKLRSNYGYDETVYPEMDFGLHQASEIGVSTQGDMRNATNEFTYEIFAYGSGSEQDGYKKIEVKVDWDETRELL